MMLGTRDVFEYLECRECGTLQLIDVPYLPRYYPDTYLSLGDAENVDLSRTSTRRIAARMTGRYLVTGRGWAGKFILRLKPWVAFHYPFHDKPEELKLTLDSKILDFGCGTGHLLQSLHYFGFRSLTGADIFIKTDIEYSTGVKIWKRGLSEIEPYFDLVMLNHSFEHLPNPKEALLEIRRTIVSGDYVLIRMPVVGDTWRRYGTDWIQLDPPRHLFLFTEIGFTALAEESGFSVEKVVYDSAGKQFWGSEQYRSDISLFDPRGHEYPNKGELFSKEQMEDWENEARRLNRLGRGDQAAFYLRKR